MSMGYGRIQPSRWPLGPGQPAASIPKLFSSDPMTHALKGDDNHIASKLNRNNAMQKHTALPVADGLYWYFENGASEPRPVMINKERWGAVDEVV